MTPHCPKCHTALAVHPDPSYYGEMYLCNPGDFMAYFDAWDAQGNYAPQNDPWEQ